jgi:4-amino-4-deoxy-L-arabinose transferase-like glycosyltransferase
MSALALLQGALSLGAGVLFALRALPSAPPLAACAGAALGLGLWSSLYAAALFAGLPPWAGCAAAAVALLGALLLRPVAAPAQAAPPDPAPRWLRRLLAATLALTAVFAIEHALRFPDGGWDAWMIWNSRARALHRADAHFQDAFAPALGRAEFRTHSDYPLLWPGLVAQGFQAAGSESAAVPAVLALLLGALLAATAALAVRALRGGTAAALCALALASTPAFATLAAGQCADVPLSLFVTGALACALLAPRQGTASARAWVLCGALLSLGAWTKNEGALALLALPASLLLLRRAPLRALASLALGALPALLLLAYFKLAIAPPNDMIEGGALATLRRAADPSRWLTLSLVSLRRLVYFQLWGVHLVGAALAVPLLWRRRERRPLGEAALPLCLCALLALAFGAAYLTSPHDLAWHFRTSIDRLLLQIWPPLLMGLSLAVPRTGD